MTPRFMTRNKKKAFVWRVPDWNMLINRMKRGIIKNRAVVFTLHSSLFSLRVRRKIKFSHQRRKRIVMIYRFFIFHVRCRMTRCNFYGSHFISRCLMGSVWGLFMHALDGLLSNIDFQIVSPFGGNEIALNNKVQQLATQPFSWFSCHIVALEFKSLQPHFYCCTGKKQKHRKIIKNPTLHSFCSFTCSAIFSFCFFLRRVGNVNNQEITFACWIINALFWVQGEGGRRRNNVHTFFRRIARADESGLIPK